MFSMSLLLTARYRKYQGAVTSSSMLPMAHSIKIGLTAEKLLWTGKWKQIHGHYDITSLFFQRRYDQNSNNNNLSMPPGI
jgi:hypothetical protein